MPIPQLTPNGLLPAGVHTADLQEIGQVFGGSNPRRVELFEKFGQFVALAQSFELFRAVFVDGSFTTDKDLPGDVDAVLELPRAALGTLLAHPNGLRLVDVAAVKTTYEVHLFFQPPPPVASGIDMADFFQHLKPEEAILRKLPPSSMRGILKVSL